MSEYRVVLTKGKKFWFWVLKGSNGRTLAHSEQYSSKRSAHRTSDKLAAALGCVHEEEIR